MEIQDSEEYFQPIPQQEFQPNPQQEFQPFPQQEFQPIPQQRTSIPQQQFQQNSSQQFYTPPPQQQQQQQYQSQLPPPPVQHDFYQQNQGMQFQAESQRLSEVDMERQEDMQHYLCQYILNQGYDGEKFGDYLDSRYPGAGLNLSLITFDQLKKVVEDFKVLTLQSYQQQEIGGQQVFQQNNDFYANNILSDQNQPQDNNEFIQHSRKKDLKELALFSKGNPSQFALNKSLAQQSSIGSSQRFQAGEISKSSLPKASNDPNQSILNSNFSSSRMVKDSRGQEIIRKEVQIIPETSIIKDNFIKKNLQGEEYSKVISCKKMEPSKIADFYQQQQDALQQYNNLVSNLNQKATGLSQTEGKSDLTLSSEFVPKKPKIIKLGVKVERYEKIEEGMFVSNYAVYEIKTSGPDWTVLRRYSDFEWLYLTLKKRFPGRIVPPIPKKKTLKELNDNHLYDRMRAFEQFLNALLICPVLSLSQELGDFLSTSDQKAFEALRKEIIVFPKLVDEITTPTGELVSEMTQSLRDFWNYFQDENVKSMVNFNQLNEEMEQLVNALNKAGQHSNQIGNIFSKMFKIQEQFNKASPIGQVQQLEKLYSYYNNMFMEFAQCQINIAKAFSTNIFEYTKYHHQTLEEFNAQTSFRNNLETEYLEKLKKLQQKKEKLFLQPAYASKWQIDEQCELTIMQLQNNKTEALKYMLSSETKQLEQQGEYFGFINQSLYYDTTIHLDYFKDKSCNRAISLTQDIALELNKLHIKIADFNMLFADLLGKKESSLNSRNRPDP